MASTAEASGPFVVSSAVLEVVWKKRGANDRVVRGSLAPEFPPKRFPRDIDPTGCVPQIFFILYKN